jgi:hypothetical protein
MRRLTILLLLALVATACADVAAHSDGPGPQVLTETVDTATTTTVAPTTTTTTVPTVDYASRVKPLGSAIFDPDAVEPPPPPPVTLTIESIGVRNAPIVDVGVLDNGEMEIPGRSEVGWYQFGPRPGEEGSSVLAAHIAFNGSPGVFRRLARIDPGAVFEVGFADGSSQRFEVFELGQYKKDELPFDRVFSRTGDPIVTLITCGGDFNRSLNSYEDNVVAYAVPIDG